VRPESLLSEQLRKSIFLNMDLSWFYNELPEPPPRKTSGLSEVVESLSDLDNRWWTEEEVKRHLDMMKDMHRKRVEQLRASQQFSYRTFFRRRREGKQRAEVRDDDLSGCLRTAVGGSGKQFLIRAGHGQVKMRAMTPREYARLQGVPDEYPITVNSVQALTGFGDAVCVPVVSWIAKYALNPLVKKCSSLYQFEVPNGG
jgi:DNA (cytosine-5)-methyltransferase 1